MKDYINKSIAANYFRGIEAVGGKITFDETGLTFSSHAFNMQRGSTRIDYSDIQDVQKKSNLGFIPNGILIITNNGIQHRFVINNRNNIIEFLHSRL